MEGQAQGLWIKLPALCHRDCIHPNNYFEQVIKVKMRGSCQWCVVAQWQSTGSLSQRPWVWLPVAPPISQALCHFKGPWMVTAQIVSLIRHNHYQSLDHRGVLSIALLPPCALWSAQRLLQQCRDAFVCCFIHPLAGSECLLLYNLFITDTYPLWFWTETSARLLWHLRV